ncbi:unnamed protein product [Caretta caretta]
MLLVVQDPGNLAQVEACQAVYLATSSARANWVKSSGLVVGDGWQASSFPPVLQAIRLIIVWFFWSFYFENCLASNSFLPDTPVILGDSFRTIFLDT